MRHALPFIAAVLAALAWIPPGTAATSDRVATVELSPQGRGLYVQRVPGTRFTLAGLQWRGSGRVELRTRSSAGTWSAWREAAPEAEDGPDRGSAESRLRGWRVGNPWWVGASDRIQARAVGAVTRIRARLVWSPEIRIPYRRPAMTTAPSIAPRAAWGANEAIRRAPPAYAREIRFVVVHHTAGSNTYTRAEAPAVVRGIQLYHVQSNGWNDIGYNFLVDRFGTIYEGRYGGIDRNVVGAHALGFNTGSVGIAVLGTYGSDAPSRAARDAVARLIAWRLDLAHVDPTAFVSVISGGSERYPRGVPVLLSAVAGHRDTGLTECPGDAFYAGLGAMASEAKALGGQKIFEPKVEIVESLVRIGARLSRSGPWVVTITDPSGAEVARGSGRGTAVDWTWDSSTSPSGDYTWTVSAGTARVASGTLSAGGGAGSSEIETAVEPAAITPNGDGQADAAILTYRLPAAANVTIEIVDVSGAVAATVVDRVWTGAGEHTAPIVGDALAEGRYDVLVTARSPMGELAQSSAPLTVSRTLGAVEVAPSAFSPNGDGRKDRLTVTFALTMPAEVRVRVERDGRWVATPLVASLPTGPHRVAWSGTRSVGALRDGSYTAVVEVVDPIAPASFAVPFVTDTAAPRVRVLHGRGVRIRVNEPSTLKLLVDGRSLRREVRRPGTVRIPWAGPARRIRAVAWDAAGNSSGPVVRIERARSSERGQ